MPEANVTRMVAVDAAYFEALTAELTRLRAERDAHAITLACQRHIGELEARIKVLELDKAILVDTIRMLQEELQGVIGGK